MQLPGGHARLVDKTQIVEFESAAVRHDQTRFKPKALDNINLEISRGEMRWVLVEAAGQILPEVGEAMCGYTARLLRRRGIEVRLRTRLLSAAGGHVVLDDGEEFDTGTIVWTAGVAPSPV